MFKTITSTNDKKIKPIHPNIQISSAYILENILELFFKLKDLLTLT